MLIPKMIRKLNQVEAYSQWLKQKDIVVKS